MFQIFQGKPEFVSGGTRNVPSMTEPDCDPETFERAPSPGSFLRHPVETFERAPNVALKQTSARRPDKSLYNTLSTTL